MSIGSKQRVIIDILGDITEVIYDMIKCDRLKSGSIIMMSVPSHNRNMSFTH